MPSDVAALAGTALGPFRIVRLLGQDRGAGLYLATMEPAHDLQITLKVLDPGLVARAGFSDRFSADLKLLARLHHPHLLPIYRHGLFGDRTCVAMKHVEGGTLVDRMRSGRIEPRQTLEILRKVASALQATHESGLVHRDLSPANIFFDEGEEPVVAGFGTAPINLGISVGTPGYLAPEQALGQTPTRQADMYSLAAIAFEMLVGSPPYNYTSTPDLLIATVHAPVPSASQRRPDLPPELDTVLARGLAKDSLQRHATAVDLVEELGRVPWAHRPNVAQVEIGGTSFKGAFDPIATPSNGHGIQADVEFEQANKRLQQLFQTALSAAVIVDEGSFIVDWNDKAEEIFGWTRDQARGRSLQSTIIPAQYREAHERGFRHYLDTGEGPVLGKVVEISALRRDGTEFPIELSISPAARSGTKALFLGFIRDITDAKRADRLRIAQDQVLELIRQEPTLEDAAPQVLEIIGTHLDWRCGSFWRVEPGRRALHCIDFWKEPSTHCPELERATRLEEFGPGQDLVGRVWQTGDSVWIEDVLHEPDMPRALPALRAGMHAAVAVPVLGGGEVRGILELFAAEPRPEQPDVLHRLYDLGRRMGRLPNEDQVRRSRSLRSRIIRRLW